MVKRHVYRQKNRLANTARYRDALMVVVLGQVQLFAVVVSKRRLHSTRCARKNRKYQKCGHVNVDGYLSQEATECRKCALGRPSSPGEAKYRTRSDFTTGHIGAYSRSEGLPGILPPRALQAD